MTNKYSKNSLKQYATLCKELQLACDYCLQRMDISVIQGERDKVKQDDLFRRKLSHVKYPLSYHNVGEEAGRDLSDAVDLYIWDKVYGSLTLDVIEKIHSITGLDIQRIKTWIYMQYATLNAYMQEVANQIGFKLTWGGDWKQHSAGTTVSHGILDSDFHDLFHWQIER